MGFVGLLDMESNVFVVEFYGYQILEEVVYFYCWEKDMFVMWDNCLFLYVVIGGYDGYDWFLYWMIIVDIEFQFSLQVIEIMFVVFYV